MSRSYKHSPFVRDPHHNLKKVKREASKMVRRAKDITNGNMYRKVYCTWNIHDYSFYCSRDILDPKWMRK